MVLQAAQAAYPYGFFHHYSQSESVLLHKVRSTTVCLTGMQHLPSPPSRSVALAVTPLPEREREVRKCIAPVWSGWGEKWRKNHQRDCPH
ncbi:MAG: hypothetical protein Q6M04_04640, partial [Thermostichus sp. BF3_bins_97]